MWDMEMKATARTVGIVLVMLVVLSAGMAGGVVLDRQVLLAYAPPSGVAEEVETDFELIAEAWNTIDRVYVDRDAVQPRRLAYGAIAGMVSALGDTGHSRFMEPQSVEQHRTLTRGEFEGIGAHVQMKDDRVVIVSPMDGSPAQEAGLMPGDVILDVDGEGTLGQSLDQVVSRILGPAGTPVTLTVLDPASGQTRKVSIVRAQIRLKNVSWEMVPGSDIAHLRISSFSRRVTEDLSQALVEIDDRQARGLILDLRSNPGGLLTEAVGTASQFMDEGAVLLQQDASGELTTVSVRPGGATVELPMVVLINAGSASAAEIVAGALQDAQRATLVGETSFGTGTVLQEFGLSDGSGLLLAIELWLSPSGRVIWHEGITPDQRVSPAPGAHLLMPESYEGMTNGDVLESGDEQLLRALDILSSRERAESAAEAGNQMSTGD